MQHYPNISTTYKWHISLDTPCIPKRSTTWCSIIRKYWRPPTMSQTPHVFQTYRQLDAALSKNIDNLQVAHSFWTAHASKKINNLIQHYSKISTWMLLVSFVIIRNNTRVSYVHNSVSENPKSSPRKMYDLTFLVSKSSPSPECWAVESIVMYIITSWTYQISFYSIHFFSMTTPQQFARKSQISSCYIHNKLAKYPNILTFAEIGFYIWSMLGNAKCQNCLLYT
jgi:hypothetical protein